MARIVDGNEMNLIGRNLRRIRTSKKMSQQTLSNRLEMMAIYVCRGSISRIEEMKRTVTDIELYGIARVLGVSVSELLAQDDSDTSGVEV